MSTPSPLQEYIQIVSEQLGLPAWHISFTHVRSYLRDNKEIKANQKALSFLEELGSKRFNYYRDQVFLPNISDLDLELEQEKRVVKKNKEAQSDLVEQELFFKHFNKISDKTFANKINVTPYKIKKDGPLTREVNLMISDTHFHSMLKASNGTVEYGPLEESRRLAAVTQQVCEYKIEHRRESTLNIHLLGDLIAGDIHWPREGDTLAAQVCSAIKLLSQMISYTAAYYPKIKVMCVSGNHGRWPNRKDRDLVDKSNSVETVIYFALKTALAHIPNVSIEIPNSPFYIQSGIGGDLFMTHGDTCFTPGNVSTQINIRTLEQQATRIKGSLNPNIKVLGCGHVHCPTIAYLPNGSAVVINGALIPSDQYAQGIGIFSTSCGQWIFESVAGYPLGDSRLAVVDTTTDKDASLDKIIQPFTNY